MKLDLQKYQAVIFDMDGAMRVIGVLTAHSKEEFKQADYFYKRSLQTTFIKRFY